MPQDSVSLDTRLASVSPIGKAVADLGNNNRLAEIDRTVIVAPGLAEALENYQNGTLGSG